MQAAEAPKRQSRNAATERCDYSGGERRCKRTGLGSLCHSNADHDVEIEDSPRGGDGGKSAL